MRKMNVIRSHRHEIFSETVDKFCLSTNDDKRIILEDAIQTLAHGHYAVRRKKCSSKMNPENISFNAVIVSPTTPGKTRYLVNLLTKK